MANADWWARAHTTPIGEDRPGAEADQTTLTATRWTLTYKSHTAKAELWAVQGVAGYDLRYTIDGELRETQLFKGVDGGTAATLRALDKRDELLKRGWTA